MDDELFDKIVGEKLEDFPSEFDHAALADFHARMDDVALVPWWRVWIKRAGWLGLLLLLTMNGAYFWASMEDKAELVTLRSELDDWQCLAEERLVDTIFIQGRKDTVVVVETVHQHHWHHASTNGSNSSSLAAESRPPPQAGTNQNQTASPASSTGGGIVASNSEGDNDGATRSVATAQLLDADVASKDSKQRLGSQGDTPLTAAVATSENKGSNTASEGINSEAGKVRMVIDTNDTARNQPLEVSLADKGTPDEDSLLDEASILLKKDTTFPTEMEIASLDSAQFFEGEQPQMKIKTPFGVQIGAGTGLFLPMPEIGVGEVSWGGGLAAEMIMSYHWRLHVGAELARPRYRLENLDEGSVSANQLAKYPNVRDDLGTLMTMDVRSNTVDFPIRLKYFFHTGHESRFFLGAGWAPSLYWYQFYSAGYENNGATVANVVEQNNLDFYTGSYDFTAGYEHDLGVNFRWQLRAYYRGGLSKFGREERELNLIGLSTSFWWIGK